MKEGYLQEENDERVEEVGKYKINGQKPEANTDIQINIGD